MSPIADLRKRAGELDIGGRSSMRKADLVSAVTDDLPVKLETEQVGLSP